MDFTGQTLRCQLMDDGLAELCFDRQGESINKFDQPTLDELAQALDLLEAEPGLRGLLISSGKGVFIVGADIGAFQQVFARPAAQVVDWVGQAQALFNRIEDLPCPSVSAVNGYALGGGLELAMTATWRVLAEEAVVGQPEVKLGLIPGFGGTVRLPRLVGLDTALELIATGREVKAAEALRLGLASAVVPADRLREAALGWLRAKQDPPAWQAASDRKRQPVTVNATERGLLFALAGGRIRAETRGHYPAPLAALDVMERAAGQPREAALRIEAEAFVGLGKGPVAANMIGLFFAEQALKKTARGLSKGAPKVGVIAVAGAGQMGAGIAALAAERGLAVTLHDVAPGALQRGMAHLTQRLQRAVGRGRLTLDDLPGVLARVQTTASAEGVAGAQLAVEAVLEDPAVKGPVLAALEQALGPEGVLCTNTSTLPLALLGKGLQRPERFCGLHFFHPVHGMPLVEVVRGAQTAPEAVAAALAVAQRLGKSPVVVADVPGFLVNRVLAAYLQAFQALLVEGADPYAVDAAMEDWGWPMGPARLCDAMGLDVVGKAGAVLARAYPEWMAPLPDAPAARLAAAGRLGEKSGLGFYRHTPGRGGRSTASRDPELATLLPGAGSPRGTPPADAVQRRLMLAMTLEGLRCLEEGVVGSAPELDMALVLGLGFPAFRGGLLRAAEHTGAAELLGQAEADGGTGLFAPPALLQDWAKGGPAPYARGA